VRKACEFSLFEPPFVVPSDAMPFARSVNRVAAAVFVPVSQNWSEESFG
jgi:hypothetical protein